MISQITIIAEAQQEPPSVLMILGAVVLAVYGVWLLIDACGHKDDKYE